MSDECTCGKCQCGKEAPRDLINEALTNGASLADAMRAHLEAVLALDNASAAARAASETARLMDKRSAQMNDRWDEAKKRLRAAERALLDASARAWTR